MSGLSGKNILLSASLSPDLRTGECVAGLEKAIGDLCYGLVSQGATVVYGGNLAPNSFTEIIAAALSKSDPDSENPVFIHVIDEPTLAGSTFGRLYDVIRLRQSTPTQTFGFINGELGQFFLKGNTVEFSTERSIETYDQGSFPSRIGDGSVGEAFAHARKWKANFSDACIAIGGKTGILQLSSDRYFGNLPGVAEELISVLEMEKPVIALGAYGGCAAEIAKALGLLNQHFEVPVEVERQDGFAQAMDILSGMHEKIPPHILGDLSTAAQMQMSPDLVELASTIITNWDGYKPRTTPIFGFGGS